MGMPGIERSKMRERENRENRESIPMVSFSL
jgi:hypothetical protein